MPFHFTKKYMGLYIATIASIIVFAMSNSGAQELKKQVEKDIVLIGASVGNGWKFPDLPKRTGIKGYNFEFIPVFDSFDKSPAIDSVIKRSHKPDVVIIKECSVYFPGNLAEYKQKVTQWVGLLEKNNIKPILATSVPPGQPSGITNSIKQTIKQIVGKPSKIDSVTEYNDWVRSYANEKGIKVLDLEQALRVSNEDRHLNPLYDRGDYVHLNPEGYKKLDVMAEKFFEDLK